MLKFSRRVEALSHSDAVLVRFGGRSGTLIEPNCAEVTAYAARCGGPGQNLYIALFYNGCRKVVEDALKNDISALMVVNSGPLGLSGPRLQRMVNARTNWGRK